MRGGNVLGVFWKVERLSHALQMDQNPSSVGK